MGFDNKEYEFLIKQSFKYIFYFNDVDNPTKIYKIRQYCEIIIRKLLNISSKEQVTLGDHNLMKRLKDHCSDNKLLMTAVKKIRKLGNLCTHTKDPKKLEQISEKETTDMIYELFNIYAIFFILYFEKYKFGSSDKVMGVFSILPPILRYIVLDYLYKNDDQNISVICKLALASLKAFDKDYALDWCEKNKNNLEKLLSISPEAILGFELQYGKQYVEAMIANEIKSMYVVCLTVINEVSVTINTLGLLYNNFEEAKQLYLREGLLPCNSQEYKDFNDIMEFIYLGREATENKKLENLHAYDTTFFMSSDDTKS